MSEPESFYDFIHPKSQGQGGFLFEVYSNNSPHAIAREVLQSALGDIPRICTHCGGFCDAHITILRDAFFRRAKELAEAMIHAITIYQMERALGILEPEQITYKVFDYWNRMSLLYGLSEPQDYMDPIQEDEEEEEQSDSE